MGTKNCEKNYLKLSARLVLSNGEENGHFSPVAISAYANTIDEEKAKNGEIDFIQSENEKAMANNLSIIDEERLKRRFAINLKERFFKTDENGEPNSFDFKIESVGVMPPFYIFGKSISVLAKKLMNLMSNLDTRNENNIEIKPSITLSNGFDIIVDGETDTVGNVVQSYLTNMFASYALPKEERQLVSISYYRTHPLEKKIIFCVKPIENDFDKCISTVIIPGIRKILELLNKILHEIKNKKEYLDELKRIK